MIFKELKVKPFEQCHGIMGRVKVKIIKALEIENLKKESLKGQINGENIYIGPLHSSFSQHTCLCIFYCPTSASTTKTTKSIPIDFEYLHRTISHHLVF